MADIGLVGYPSAGKSSLIAAMSAARPKIADYPFTTLVPNLGVVQAGETRFTAADVPGLIPGASQGKGLGHEFLRHVERCAALVHVLDCATLETDRDPVKDFDVIGLHKANLEGMRRAIKALEVEPEYVLTDGYEISGLGSESLAIWKGDQVAISISAASILAKVYRDRIMINLDRQYPGYHFADHKGYVTRTHERSLNELGVTAIHRKSYANIQALINK